LRTKASSPLFWNRTIPGIALLDKLRYPLLLSRPNHIIICLTVMAKKVAISVTIDRDVLRDVDNLLRNVQEKELRSRRSLSNRSSLIERLLADGVRTKSE